MIGFENCEKMEEVWGISSLSDERLLKIDPQEDGFYDNILDFSTNDRCIKKFIEAVKNIKNIHLEAFYKPAYDPSYSDECGIFYKKGEEPAVGYSFNWWCEEISKLPTVEGRRWTLANEHQYYAFLMYLINALVKHGENIEKALDLVVNDSTNVGHYCNSSGSKKTFEQTGSRCVAGVYDLGNTYKILECSDPESDGFWIGGGDCNNFGDFFPLSHINNIICVDDKNRCGVGMLVL